jgi:hypothetical protein
LKHFYRRIDADDFEFGIKSKSPEVNSPVPQPKSITDISDSISISFIKSKYGAERSFLNWSYIRIPRHFLVIND